MATRPGAWKAQHLHVLLGGLFQPLQQTRGRIGPSIWQADYQAIGTLLLGLTSDITQYNQYIILQTEKNTT